MSYETLEDLIYLQSTKRDASISTIEKNHQKILPKKQDKNLSINLTHCKYQVVKDIAEVSFNMNIIETNDDLNKHNFDVFWSDTVIFKFFISLRLNINLGI